jgi:pimeloyl-ACP methyl ester carboxylesterase
LTEAETETERLTRVEEAFSSLPERFLGSETPAIYRVELEDIERDWLVELQGDRCAVAAGGKGRVDVTIKTDAETWLELREGRLSGLDAFAQRRLHAVGDLDLAIAFEGMFELPGGRQPLLRVHEVEAGKARISAITAAGGDETVVCLHGLGGNKTSFFETISALSPQYTVHAIDFPGFGSSSKPARASYDAPWFARSVVRFLDAMGIRRAHLIGNSMGGRVGIEVALAEPSRVCSLSLLAPAVAWRQRRALVPVVRLLRPELAAIPHPLDVNLVRRQFWSMFARPERLHPSAAEIASEQFLRTYRSHAARIAFYAALRNIYLDSPFGERGFWTRLSMLEPPALFVWGSHDRLVPASFERHVREVLPEARQVRLEDCGHVPQVELPELTNELLRSFISDSSSLRARMARSELAAHAGRLSRAARRMVRPRVAGAG